MKPDSVPSPPLLAYARPGKVSAGVNPLAWCAAAGGIISLVLFYSDYSGLRIWALSRATVLTSCAAIAVSLTAILSGWRTHGVVRFRRLLSVSLIGLLAGAAPLAVATIAPRRPSCCIPPRAKCASNLREIGAAAQIFAIEHDGQLPDDITDFFNEDLIPGVFVCPATHDTPAAAGPTTQATGANVEAPGHCSYVYLGKYWMADELTPNVVVAYEPLKNHQSFGMNVLYGDGRVDWLNASEANKLLAELNAGHNPPQVH